MQLTLNTLLQASLLASSVSAFALPDLIKTRQTTFTTVGLTGKKASGGAFSVEPAPEGDDSQALQKRGAVVVVLGIAGTAALAKVAEIAIEIGAETIANLGKWNEAREEFTKATTNEMMKQNPDPATFPAAACYNKGYDLATPANIDALADVDFSLGLLKTDYDCMYIKGPNQFFTRSEGGFINLSYTYNPDRCSFDQSTGDLSCT